MTELLENPIKAIRDSYRVLKKGGIAIHTTCFLYHLHPSLKDYCRFSPDDLKYFCKELSEILQCEGWGTRMAILLSFISSRFTFMNIPESKMSILRWIDTRN